MSLNNQIINSPLSSWGYRLAGFISEELWGRLSASIHLFFSRLVGRAYQTRLSKYFIQPYCWRQYGDRYHYKKFKPGNGSKTYQSFQDFFTREFQVPPQINSTSAWPCEGFLCDSVSVSHADPVKVKGEYKNIRSIFGKSGPRIPNDYHFANVFLHNNNYHQIHAPVSGTIEKIEHIPGELLLLRPWAYPSKPSLPALRNERVNVNLRADDGKLWFLSIIGGPAVATVKLVANLSVGSHFHIGDKLAGFLMGSTCCIASPTSPHKALHSEVTVGDKF